MNDLFCKVAGTLIQCFSDVYVVYKFQNDTSSSYIGIPWIESKSKWNVVIVISKIFSKSRPQTCRSYRCFHCQIQTVLLSLSHRFKTHRQRPRGRFTQVSSIKFQYSS